MVSSLYETRRNWRFAWATLPNTDLDVWNAELSSEEAWCCFRFADLCFFFFALEEESVRGFFFDLAGGCFEEFSLSERLLTLGLFRFGTAMNESSSCDESESPRRSSRRSSSSLEWLEWSGT
jgi:hypothetical protein